MFDSDDKLAAACQITTQAAREALEWVGTTENNVVRSNGGLEKKLRKCVVNGAKLEHAATRKMCVGVFGASQAGKSYLISALARKGQNPLMARFGDQLVDFADYINPFGEKESTGLVTRFTVDRPRSLPPGHSVQVGLLSEIDVVKVLANSFVFDVQHAVREDERDGQDADDDREARLFRALDTLRALPPVSSSPLRVEDVFDLEDYCNSRLTGNDRIKLLRGSGFWDEAADLAPRLDAEGRGRLFSLLWEELPVFTGIYTRLVSALARLDHARDAYCEMSALVSSTPDGWARNAMSLINVSALNGIGEVCGDMVSVVAPGGSPVLVERAELTALIAELKIVMDEQPFPFFSHTDLLDFPGARTRKPEPKDNELLSNTATRTENFLRGKVAYLFERYCEEQELSSMLLCVGPSNQEVATLPGMIEDWICATHGKTPQERDNIETALFFVMTKFDTAFAQGAGKSMDGSRWTARIEASLLSPFKKPHGTQWVTRWNSRGNFNNVFWVRNPTLRQDALFDYESSASQVEIGVREEKKAFVETLKTAYLAAEEVRTYVADPEVAWDAGMQINDGGIMRLAESLAPICRPEMKRQQVAERLRGLQAEVRGMLSPYYISGDVDSVREEKTSLAKAALRMLAGCFQRQRLGEFQHCIRLDENQAHLVFQSAERAASQLVAANRDAERAPEPAPIVTYASSGGDDLLSDLGLDDGHAHAASATADGGKADVPKRQQDLAEKFVFDLEKSWSDMVAELAGDKQAMDYLGLDGDVVVRLAQELLTGARRSGVIDQMVNAVRAAQQYKSSQRDVWIWRQVSPASCYFNDYLAWLGCRGKNPEGAAITNLQGQACRIFAPRPEVTGKVTLDEQLQSFERPYFTDWLQALQATIRANAEYQAGFAGNVEENDRLGRILERVSGQGAAH